METILVLDFVRDNLILVQNILKPKFNVLLTESVEEAKKMIAEADHAPEILLINQVIPGSSGVEALKELSKSEKNFVAMMMTGVKDMEVVVDAISHGFDGFIKIPIELEKFLEQLKKSREINKLRSDAAKYLKVKAIKAMTITFSHYTRNLLTPLIGYLPKLKSKIPDDIFESFNKNLHKINKLTRKFDELLESEELHEYSYTDGTEFFEIDLDDNKKH